MLNLEDREWSEFYIGELFTVAIGKNVDGNKVDKNNGDVAYITRKESRNGLDGFIGEDESFLNKEFPVITIGNETAEPFVQTFPFFTGTKVNILKPNDSISKYSLMFVAQSLKKHKSKYSYSYTINSTRLKRQIIMLPVNNAGEPDWRFMEDYVKEREHLLINQYRDYIQREIDSLEKFGGGAIQ